ncbi:MAG TPA: response regulator, partial [Polyangiaceae bacterium]
MPRPAILVVDDHPANILAIESVLEPLPFRTVAAASGTDALRIAATEEFVLILMDVLMPGLDGFETVDRLRQLEGTREAPVVFFTAVHDTAEHARRAYELGAVDFIAKPFDPDVLRAKVQALVSLYTRGRREERARREEMDRLKDLFLGAVGHDLRNPLNAFVMGTKLLRMQACSHPSHASVAERLDRSAR